MTLRPDMADTLFPDWRPPAYPDWVDRMPKAERRFFTLKLSYASNAVHEAQDDGLEQLVPVIAVFGGTRAAARREVGKPAWRVFHRGTLATNVNRVRLWVRWRYNGEGRRPLSEILELRPCHLRSVLRVTQASDLPSAFYAGRMAPPNQYREIAVLYRDTVRMGMLVNPQWSLRRLHKEHDAMVRESVKRAADPKPWAQRWSVEIDGYRIERLVSDQDLAVEGAIQRHCVGSYRMSARQGRSFLFSISGEERATLELSARHRIKQIKAFANRQVSPQCRRAAAKAANAFALAEAERRDAA